MDNYSSENERMFRYNMINGPEKHEIFSQWNYRQDRYIENICHNDIELCHILVTWSGDEHIRLCRMLRVESSVSRRRQDFIDTYRSFIDPNVYDINNKTILKLWMLLQRWNRYIIQSPRVRNSMYVFRGIMNANLIRRINEMKSGESFTNICFMSTSFDMMEAMQFTAGGGIILTILITPETPIIKVENLSDHKHEKEGLLCAGSVLVKISSQNIFYYAGIDANTDHNAYHAMQNLLPTAHFGSKIKTKNRIGTIIFNGKKLPHLMRMKN